MRFIKIGEARPTGVWSDLKRPVLMKDLRRSSSIWSRRKIHAADCVGGLWPYHVTFEIAESSPA